MARSSTKLWKSLALLVWIHQPRRWLCSKESKGKLHRSGSWNYVSWIMD